MLNNPGIKIAQVAELRGKSESTVWKQLNELTKKGIIEYQGSDKSGGYYVKCDEGCCLGISLFLWGEVINRGVKYEG